MTSLHLLLAYLRYAELWVLDCKSVVPQPQVRPYSKNPASLLIVSDIPRSRIPPSVAITKLTR